MCSINWLYIYSKDEGKIGVTVCIHQTYPTALNYVVGKLHNFGQVWNSSIFVPE